MSATRLINAKQVKQFMLEVAAKNRPFNKFNRVSNDTLLRAHETLRSFCIEHVRRHPSKGKTL